MSHLKSTTLQFLLTYEFSRVFLKTLAPSPTGFGQKLDSTEKYRSWDQQDLDRSLFAQDLDRSWFAQDLDRSWFAQDLNRS